jgi:HAE1 family hydrophobic/amphiphilic exporter-1
MVISIVMVIVGIVAMLSLPTAQFPNITPPEVQVKTTYVGADALTVEQSVATPIEQQMSGVDNMNYMYSNNANNGQITLTVNFDVKTDPNTDQILSQMRANQAASQLPAEVNSYGVTVQKSTAAPLMLFDLYSPNGTYDSEFLANYAYINLNDQLTRVAGIASVSVFGAGQYAMRFWVKPDQLAKLQITVPEIINAIQTQNNVNPAGQIGSEPVPPGQEYTYTVRSQRLFTNPQRLPVAEPPFRVRTLPACFFAAPLSFDPDPFGNHFVNILSVGVVHRPYSQLTLSICKQSLNLTSRRLVPQNRCIPQSNPGYDLEL